MGHFTSVKDLPEGGEHLDLGPFGKVLGPLKLVGLVGVILSFVLTLISDSFAYSWLFAFCFFFTITMGGLFWVLLHNAINAGWGIAVRRLFENLANLMPWMALFALPFFLFSKPKNALWEWMGRHDAVMEVKHEEQAEGKSEAKAEAKANTEVGAEVGTGGKEAKTDSKTDAKLDTKEGSQGDDKLAASKDGKDSKEAKKKSTRYALKYSDNSHDYLLYKKYAYLNKSFWHVRFVLYFVLLSFGAYVVRRYSLKQEKDGLVKHTFSARRFSCGWLPIFAVCLTFAGIDWLMALDYTWFSTMWGVYIFAGSALSSMALMIVVVTFLRSRGYLQKVVTMEHYHLMGKLLFAFTVFWAYIAFSQFFLIWYANITEETRFFLMRNTAGWNLVSMLGLVLGHFVIPFVLLLMVPIKKSPKLVSMVAVWILAMHLLDMYWIVIPERGPSLVGEVSVTGAFLFDVIAFVSLAAAMTSLFFRELAKHSLYPWRDPRLQESINVSN